MPAKGTMKKNPLVVCLTNTVAAPFTANCLLAVGARPAMVEELTEAAELTAAADALLINLGTVHPVQAEAMRRAIHVAREHQVPWVMDPVGIPFLAYRRSLAEEFLTFEPSLVRGNAAECRVLGTPRCVTLATGAEDVVFDATGEVVARLTGGTPRLTAVTATGCAQGGLCAAALGRGETPRAAAEWASRLMKAAGERAAAVAPGIGQFQVALLDALEALSRD